jgi:aminoglycoside phosphotransferase (APT) family kinase protein
MQPTDIERALEHAQILPSRVTEIDEVGDGWESRVFRVSRPGANDVALRLYTADTTGQTLRAEVAAYLALEDVDYPAPRLLAQHTGTEPLGGPFILIDWLDGPVVDVEPTPETLEMLTALLARLHDIEPNEELIARHQIPIRTNEGVIAERRSYLEGADLDGFLPSLKWLADQLRGLSPLPGSYVHMDFHPKNVILTSDGPAVFDWGSFAIADPRSDVAWTHLLVRTYLGDDAAGRFLSAYRRLRPESLDEFSFFEVSAIWRRFLIIVVMLRENPPAGVMEQVMDAIRLLEPAYRRLVDATGTTIAEVEDLYAPS